MSLQLEIEEKIDYLVARFTGAADGREVGQQFNSIAEHCRSANKSKLLINVTGVKADFSFMDRYNMGESGMIFANYGIKVAMVARPEQIDLRRFGELVARNRGVDVRGFTDVEAAEEWLLK